MDIFGAVVAGGQELYFICYDFGNVSSYTVAVVVGAGLDGSAYANFRTFLKVSCAVFRLTSPAYNGEEVGLLIATCGAVRTVNSYGKSANADVRGGVLLLGVFGKITDKYNFVHNTPPIRIAW